MYYSAISTVLDRQLHWPELVTPVAQSGGPVFITSKIPGAGQPVTATVGEHLYIYASEQFQDGSGETDYFLCEGGPKNGKLEGGCNDGINQPVTNGPSGPNLPNNLKVGATYMGANACKDLDDLIVDVDLYQINGNFATYNQGPFPIHGVRSGYNSNSYAFTLLNDIGLASHYSNGNPYSWFGTPPGSRARPPMRS